MRRVLILAAMAFLPLAAGAEGNNPVAAPGAQVVAGNARFTVLTDRLIRMEWVPDGTFEDHATLAVVNRELPVPKFSVARKGAAVTIKTSALTLTYSGEGSFDGSNLGVSFKLKGKTVTWRPGADASGNLMGTARTLDGCEGPEKINFGDPMELGILSRDGWAVIDESTRHILVKDGSDWGEWVAERPVKDGQDLYLFAYGHDYKAALADYAKIAGRIPLPPKFVFGYWWSRYWAYTDDEFVALAQEFRSRQLPIDVMVIDMDWHETWRSTGRRFGGRDEFGESVGWTGYTWNSDLFSDPEGFLADIHSMHLKTSLNLHPASGIVTREKVYPAFVKDYLSRTDEYDGPRNYIYRGGEQLGNGRTARRGYHASVPFRMDQQAWADAYFNSVIHPLEAQGVDFWWLDWQQFRESRYVKGLSNTFWLNYTFWNDIARRSASLGKDAPRPIIYHRWGGIGSHRYQLGFSGDTYATWRVLSYLPYFTSTAANVGYGYWGHDIGGHMQPEGVHETDPELYTRWLQNGVFMPIFKTHSTKDMSMEKRFWVFPDHFDPMREAIRLRYTLSPYIYNAARQAYDTGISICRPLYYYCPEDERAYTCREEYFFGDDIIATVLCEAADETTGLTARKLWFPEGNDWYDVSTGRMYSGGTETTAHYTIDENPWYVRAGAIIPMASPKITSLQEQSNENWYLLVPGEGAFKTSLYEDDGKSQAYDSDYATTEVARNCADGVLTVDVSPRQGDFKGISPTRKIRIVLDGASAPGYVRVNGKQLPYDRHADTKAAGGKYACWGYDGEELRVIIYLPEMPADTRVTIECDSRFAFTDGQKGLLKRMRRITPEAKTIFAGAVSGQLQLTPELLRFAGTASYINEDPQNAQKYLGDLSKEALRADLAEYELPQDFLDKIFAWINIQ